MNRANCGAATKIDKQHNGRKQSPERDPPVYGHLTYDKDGERMDFAINGAETFSWLSSSSQFPLEWKEQTWFSLWVAEY